MIIVTLSPWFNPGSRQLEKVVYLDENSKLIKPLFKSGLWATMSAVVRLVHIQFPLETYVKDILLRSRKKAVTES